MKTLDDTPLHQGDWLRHPVLSLLLAALWLLLQQSLAPPQLITATVLGLVVPRLVLGFLGPGSLPKRWLLALRFTGVVLYDIVVSNVAVARIVLDPTSRPEPGWVRVPLTSQHPLVISLLATIITTTPGTVSAVIDETGAASGGKGDGPCIWVHALDCGTPVLQAEAAQQMSQRYEAPLRQILEGVDP